jgi:hypothetical protein
MNSGAAIGGSGLRRQAVGLSLKIWGARAPICRDRRAAFTSPKRTPRCIPTAGASAGQVRRRRGSGRATVRAMVEHDGDADLLTVGLVVFFVALVVTVAALLVAPTLL